MLFLVLFPLLYWGIIFLFLIGRSFVSILIGNKKEKNPPEVVVRPPELLFEDQRETPVRFTKETDHEGHTNVFYNQTK